MSTSSEPLLPFHCLLVCCHGWIAEGFPATITTSTSVAVPPLDLVLPPQGSLVSLQLPENEQDQGFDHWPLSLCFSPICPSVTLGQWIPITRLPTQGTIKRQLSGRESNGLNSVSTFVKSHSLLTPSLFPQSHFFPHTWDSETRMFNILLSYLWMWNASASHRVQEISFSHKLLNVP